MRLLKVFVTIVLIADFSFPAGLHAQPQDRSDAATHVVSLDQLRTTLAARTAERGRNIQEIQKLLRADR